VQDAYVKVLGRWGRLREVTKGAACLSQSVVNLSRSRLRLAARRARRARLLAVASAIAVAGAAALTVSFTGGGGLTTARPSHEASPSPDPNGVTTSSDGTPVWPFTSDAEAAAWTANPGTRPWAADPVQLTQHLLDDYLSVPGRAMRRVGDGVDLAVVEVSAGDRPVSQVRLVRVGRTSSGPWSVIGATSDDLTIAQPLPGEPVTSPMRTTGRVSGVDQSVHLQLRAATLLAEAYAPAGNELPWTQNLTWTSESWSVAALAASTFDGRGDLSAVTITAVRRGGASS